MGKNILITSCYRKQCSNRSVATDNSAENIFKKNPRPKSNTPQLLISTSNSSEGTQKLSQLVCDCLTYCSHKENRLYKRRRCGGGQTWPVHTVCSGISVLFWCLDRRPNYTVTLSELGCNALAFTPVFNCWSRQLVTCRTECVFTVRIMKILSVQAQHRFHIMCTFSLYFDLKSLNSALTELINIILIFFYKLVFKSSLSFHREVWREMQQRAFIY